MSATRQRWYCPLCRRRYWTRFCLMCELLFADKALCALADLPPFGLDDARVMAVQARFCHIQSAEELLAARSAPAPWTPGPT